MERIIDPVRPSLLKAELTPEKRLSATNKGHNELYVIDCNESPNLLREVGRLRELAFREGGGGTGRELDLDDFDLDAEHPYRQLIVWDPDAGRILGGYRFILGRDVRFDPQGQPRITSAHMFRYSPFFISEYLPHVMELGRSFVAPGYQSSKAGAKAIFALDNLWDGIAAVMLLNPGVMYFLGKMTIYPSYDSAARELVLHFLRKHFADKDALALPRNPLEPALDERICNLILHDDDFRDDYRNLKMAVRRLGTSIPPLVNSYMNISPSMRVFGTGINDEFGDVFDTGILVCFDEMYEEKRERHVRSFVRELAAGRDKLVQEISERYEDILLARMLRGRKQQYARFIKNLQKKNR